MVVLCVSVCKHGKGAFWVKIHFQKACVFIGVGVGLYSIEHLHYKNVMDSPTKSWPLGGYKSIEFDQESTNFMFHNSI